RERLNPTLKVYVEYSNEVWNFSFPQARHATDEGKRLALGEPENLRSYSQRSVEIFRIWEEEFKNAEPGRLVRVLSAQFANPWTSEQILSWKDASKHADALAVAPYFGNQFGEPARASTTAEMTVDQLLDAVQKEIDGPHRDLIQKQVAMAHKYSLP